MNKLILCLFVALTVSMIHVRWSTARLNTFFDDFVSYPSLKVKRDLEFEEFLKDGNMKEAKKRAFHRQKRANEENMSDTLKRARRNMAEAEEEEDDDEIQRRCSAEEHNNIERGTCFTCVPFHGQKIKVAFSSQIGNIHLKSPEVTLGKNCALSADTISQDSNEGGLSLGVKVGHVKFFQSGRCQVVPEIKTCTTVTETRVKEVMATYSTTSACKFEVEVDVTEAEADVIVQCEVTGGNYAPLGKSSSYKLLNLEEINGGKAGYKIINHELGHLCCLQHTQKLPGSEKVETANPECVLDGYASQFDQETCTNECSKYSIYPMTMVNTASNMNYKENAFAKDTSCSTLIPNHSSFAKLNARKTSWYSDIALIQEAYCVYCPGDEKLQKDEVYGEGCSILSMEAIATSDYVNVAMSTMCLSPEDYTVAAGESKTLQCSSDSVYIAISGLSWDGMKEHSSCKPESMRLVGKKDGQLGELAIVCGTGKDQVDYTLNCNDGEFVTVDGSATSNGALTVTVTAC